MNHSLRSPFLVNSILAVLLAGTFSRGLLAKADVAVSIHIYDYADVPRETLERAEKEATRILSDAGIATRWADCSLSIPRSDRHPDCRQTTGATRLQVRILPLAMAKRASPSPNEYGMALLPNGGFGVLASIFWHRVEQLAKGVRVLRGVYLGHFIAHEIGHLLLGDDRHSVSGLMIGEWRMHDLSYATQGKLVFSARQAAKMRGKLLERIRAHEAAENAKLPSRQANDGNSDATKNQRLI